MLLDTVIDIPKEKGRITLQKKYKSTYVLLTVSRKYDPVGKRSNPKRVTIGKVCHDNPAKMIPNDRFAEFFPEIDLGIKPINQDISQAAHHAASTQSTASTRSASRTAATTKRPSSAEAPIKTPSHATASTKIQAHTEASSKTLTNAATATMSKASRASSSRNNKGQPSSSWNEKDQVSSSWIEKEQTCTTHQKRRVAAPHHSNNCSTDCQLSTGADDANESQLLPPPYRADSLQFGYYVLIRRISSEIHLISCLEEVFGVPSAALTMDLASCLLVGGRDDVASYYPYYAWGSTLFTEGMHIYSERAVSSHLYHLCDEDISTFLCLWNQRYGDAHNQHIDTDIDNDINESYTRKSYAFDYYDFAQLRASYAGTILIQRVTQILHKAIESRISLAYEQLIASTSKSPTDTATSPSRTASKAKSDTVTRPATATPIRTSSMSENTASQRSDSVSPVEPETSSNTAAISTSEAIAAAITEPNHRDELFAEPVTNCGSEAWMRGCNSIQFEQKLSRHYTVADVLSTLDGIFISRYTNEPYALRYLLTSEQAEMLAVFGITQEAVTELSYEGSATLYQHDTTPNYCDEYEEELRSRADDVAELAPNLFD